jgi:UDP-glucose:(glucosyl)LPS alpha-1,3-glucosyltransferase
MVVSHTLHPGAAVHKRAAGQKPYHIAFGVDRFYVAAMAVTILSITACNPQTDLVFHVIVSELPAEDLQQLQQLATQCGVVIWVHDLDKECFANIPEKKAPSFATYHRLFICDILKDEATHVLYLDSDIVCLGALPTPPDIGDAVAAVVLDVEQEDRNSSLGRDKSVPYFNAGVMYIDVKNWNKDGISQKVIDCLTAHPAFRFADQDILNLVLADKIVFLNSKWNTLWMKAFKANPDLQNDVVFLHYAGQKPWLPWSTAFMDAPFAQYFAHSPWPMQRLLTPATRKNKGQYARYLMKKGRFAKALFWYIRFLCARRRT